MKKIILLLLMAARLGQAEEQATALQVRCHNDRCQASGYQRTGADFVLLALERAGAAPTLSFQLQGPAPLPETVSLNGEALPLKDGRGQLNASQTAQLLAAPDGAELRAGDRHWPLPAALLRRLVAALNPAENGGAAWASAWANAEADFQRHWAEQHRQWQAQHRWLENEQQRLFQALGLEEFGPRL